MQKKSDVNNAIHYVKKAMVVTGFCLAIAMPSNTTYAKNLSVKDMNYVGVEVTTPEAATSTETTNEAQKTGKIVTESGVKYYKDANGTKVKNQFVTVSGKTYYFGKDGSMTKGWMKKKNNYYYLDRSTGVQKKNSKVDGIKLGKDGKAKLNAYSKKKIATMIKANAIATKVTNASDTKEQKLKKVFNWVLKHPYNRHRILAKVRTKKGYEMDYANDIFKKNGDGCCVSEACAFAFLAHECGYAKVYVCDDTGHAWVEINGKVYDTLFAEAKNYNKYYNSTYKTAGLHRVNKLKI